eukprot:COSAG02_NODE_209_length_28965_cov_18.680143_5_plen_122_part_00
MIGLFHAMGSRLENSMCGCTYHLLTCCCATNRGSLLGWLLVFCCKTDQETAQRRRRLRCIIDSGDDGLIQEAFADNSADVVIVVAQAIVGLYASMLWRRFLTAFSIVLVCLSAVTVAWILA